MVFGKILVKKNYEKRGDLVYRPLFRIYDELGIESKDEINILGLVNNNEFYELCTFNKIEDAIFEEISIEEFCEILNSYSFEELVKLRKYINDVIFNKMVLSSMEELAEDRSIEFTAYNDDLSLVNPYTEPLNGYNDLSYKCKVLKKDSSYGRKM